MESLKGQPGNIAENSVKGQATEQPPADTGTASWATDLTDTE